MNMVERRVFSSLFSTGAVFEFTQQVFSSAEAIDPAVATVRLAATSAVLGSDISIFVSTAGGGTAMGE